MESVKREKFCTEDTPLCPISLYGVTKVQQKDLFCKEKTRLVLGLRLCLVYRLACGWTYLSMIFVYRAVTDRAVLIFEGHFKRNYIHIRDVVRYFCMGWNISSQ